MTTLRLLVDLFLIVPWLAWAWLKTKMPHVPAPIRRCQECGWELAEERTSLLCGKCEWEQEHQPEPTSKLFCCDVDLEYRNTERERAHSPDGDCVSATTIKTYQCPACDRIWLYVETWYPDRVPEEDWHPQWTEAEIAVGTPPPLFDERTRTTTYPKPFKL